MVEKLLRDYQTKAVDSVFSEFDRGIKRTMLVSATGTGKTTMAGYCAQRIDAGRRVLWLCHREELAFQARDALREITGREVHLEMGEYKAAHRNAPIVVAMVQSLTARKSQYGPDAFQFGFIDECHHAISKTYMSLIQYFSGIRNWLGLTATPKRADGVAMGKVFDSVAYRFEIGAAVDLGWLVAPKQRMATCREIDLRKVDTVAGDLHKGQLKAQLMQQSVVDQIARKTIAVADGRQTIVFCQTVDQSHALSRVFSLLGERSVAIDGKTPTIIRRGRVADFRTGKARFLCQVSICTEGFDVPEAEVTVMARPTKSQSLYTQSVGRILRPITPPQGHDGTARRLEIANSVKPHATVLDFVGNTGRHRLVNTGDLLGGEYDDEVRALAVQKAQSVDGDVDMHKLLEECKEAVAKRPKVLRVQEDETTSLYKRFAFLLYRYTAHPCDALGIDKSLPDRVVEKNMAYGQSLADALRELRGQRLSENEIGQMSNRQQVFVARILESREDAQLCTYPQLRILHRHGYSADMNRRQASQKIEQIRHSGNMRPIFDGPNETLLRLVSGMAARAR